MSIRGGLTGLFMGAPGTGKSWLLGTAAEVPSIERPLLLAPKPREINSFKYREQGLTENAEIFVDAGWAPVIDSYESGAFTEIYKRVLSLYDDDTYDCVLLDPFTDITYLAAHELLATEKAAFPRDLRDSIGFYGSLKYRLKDFTTALVNLAHAGKRPKHVFVAVHVQMTKEEDMKGSKTAEGKAKGISFFGDVLPLIEGSYRQEIAGEFDIQGHTYVKHALERVGSKMERVAKYVVSVNADPEKHGKAAILPRLEQAEIPNSLPELFRLIEEAV